MNPAPTETIEKNNNNNSNKQQMAVYNLLSEGKLFFYITSRLIFFQPAKKR